MITDTLVQASVIEREVFERARARRSPSQTIVTAIDQAIASLEKLKLIANMQPAYGDRSRAEEASAFVAYAQELARPLDDMWRSIIQVAADNCGGFSPIEQKDLQDSRIVSDTLNDNWLPYFELAAIGAMEPEFYTRGYVRELRNLPSLNPGERK